VQASLSALSRASLSHSKLASEGRQKRHHGDERDADRACET
jgi:hypothetical protein